MYKQSDEYRRITNKERIKLSLGSARKVRSSLERMAEDLAFPKAFHDEAVHSLYNAGFKSIFSKDINTGDINPGYCTDHVHVYNALIKDTRRVFDAYSSYLRMIKEGRESSYYEDGAIEDILASMEREHKHCWSEIVRLVDINISYVRKRSKKFNISEKYNEDLEAEGIRGMIEASVRFDPSKGYAFLTYARHWIDYYMREHSNGWRSIMLHPGARQRYNNILNRSWRVYAIRGEFPDAEELSEDLGISPKQVRDSFNYLDMNFLSGDDIYSHHDDRTLFERIPSGDSDAEDEMVSLFDFKRASDALSSELAGVLTEREITVLKMRFSDERHTLQEIGRVYGVSREYIRQIQNKAIDKLRTALQSRNMEGL